MRKAGAVYIAFGDEARKMAKYSRESLACVSKMPTVVIGDGKDADIKWEGPSPWGNTLRGGERFLCGRVKPALFGLSPFRYTMYVDADTTFLADPGLAWNLLDNGYEFAVAIAGDRQRSLAESQFNEQERWDTKAYFEDGQMVVGRGSLRMCAKFGHVPYYNSGVMFWKRCETVERLFAVWAEEWAKYGDWDEQIALERAVFRTRPRMVLLPDTWNSKDLHIAKVVHHAYGHGAARSPIPRRPKKQGGGGVPELTPASEVLAMLQKVGRHAVLDIGCGMNPRPADIYVERYADNRSRMADLKVPPGKPLVWGDIHSLQQFPNKCAEFVHCHHVLEHVEDPAAACAELLRVGRCGHITAPSENDERLYIQRGAKSYHFWLVKQEGDTLHFYPREKVAAMPAMKRPERAVSLVWTPRQPFSWVIHE